MPCLVSLLSWASLLSLLSLVSLVSLVSLAATASAVAQTGTRTPDRAYMSGFFSEAIGGLLERAKMKPLGDEELQLLGSSYMLRATFFEQMHRLQIAIGTAYYTRRDTSQGFVSIPVNDYYLGRYLFEDAKFAAASDRFSEIATVLNIDTPIRQKAAIWKAAIGTRIDGVHAAESFASLTQDLAEADADVRLELAFAQSREDHGATGVPAVRAVPDHDPDYRLVWFAARNRLLTTMSQGTEPLIANPRPDFVYNVDEEFSVSFYDPPLFDVLAYADYTAALAAFEQVSGNKEMATFGGICAYAIGDYEVATRLLTAAGTDRARIYLSLIESEDPESAVEPNLSSNRARIEWAALTGRGQALLDLVKVDETEVLQDRLTLQAVSLALIEAGAGAEVVKLVGSVYPLHRRKDDRIYPTLTAIETAAVLSLPDGDFRIVLTNLYGLIKAYPVVANVFDMAQGLAAPDGDYLVSKKRTD